MCLSSVNSRHAEYLAIMLPSSVELVSAMVTGIVGKPPFGASTSANTLRNLSNGEDSSLGFLTGIICEI